MAEMKRKGLGGMSRMGNDFDERKKPAEQEGPDGYSGDGGDDVKTHTIEEHPDGHMVSRMHDGTETEHPNHLHLMAHLGHHMTGGDKHHVAHHDGMEIHTHGVHESGEHEGPQTHGSSDEAAESMGHFMGDEGSQPQDGDDGEGEAEPAFGAM